MFPLSPAASPGCPLSPPPVGNCNSLLSNSWYAADVSSRSVFATTVRTELVVVVFAVVLVLVVVLIVSSWWVLSRPK